MEKQKKPKRVWLAVALNIFLFPLLGVGYIYLGKWGRFAITWVILFIGSFFLKMFVSYRVGYWFPLVVWIGIIIDVYFQAIFYNRKIAANQAAAPALPPTQKE